MYSKGVNNNAVGPDDDDDDDDDNNNKDNNFGNGSQSLSSESLGGSNFNASTAAANDGRLYREYRCV